MWNIESFYYVKGSYSSNTDRDTGPLLSSNDHMPINIMTKFGLRLPESGGKEQELPVV